MSNRYHGGEEMDPTSGDIFTHFVHDENGGSLETPRQHELDGHVMGSGSMEHHEHYGSGSNESFDMTPSQVDGSEMTPSNKPKTSRTRSSRSRKGRPTRMMLPLGAPTGTAYVNVGRAFPGITMVYRCPFVHCHRFYATKLALRRHFVSYNHMVTTEYIEFDNNPILSPDEVKRKAILSMPRCFKCPVLECGETFQDVFGLCGHFSEIHAPIGEPMITKRQRSSMPVHELMEWTEMFEDSIDATYNFHVDLGQSVPDMFTARDDKASWRFLSIFDIVGPRPSYKRAQFVHHLREVLLRSYNPSMNNTILINEDILKIMITLAFCEMMPCAYMLTRDYVPSQGAHLDQDGILDPWNDEEYMWNINTESVQSMLKFGAVHSSRNFVKKAKIRKSLTPDDDPEQILEREDLTNDRFVCQVPGCGKVFASVPAYKYHMNHFEHDLEALIGSSSLIRQVLFPTLKSDNDLSVGNVASANSAHEIPVNMNGGINWYSHERIHLRFISTATQPSSNKDEDRTEAPLLNLVYSVNDAVHILHGYIDQQLPIAFSWLLMKKREMTAINPITNEFTLTFKKGDSVSMMKAAPGSANIPLTTAPQKRKKKPFLFPPSLSSSGSGKKMLGGFGAAAGGYNAMLMMMTSSEEGQSLGLDPWTVGKPLTGISTLEEQPGIEIKFLPTEGIMPYMQSKLILPIHPTGLVQPGEDVLGTWLDYTSITAEESFAIDKQAQESTITVIAHSEKGVPNTASLDKDFSGFVMESGSEAVAISQFTSPESASEGAAPEMSALTCLQTLDWFPHMASSTSSSDRYVLSLVTAGAISLASYVGDLGAGWSSTGPRSSDVMLWNVIVSAKPDHGGYKIEQLKFNALLSTNPNDAPPYVEGMPLPVHTSSVISLKWYPFTLQADTNEADLKGILAVLYSNGELLVYVLPRHLAFPSNIESEHYVPQAVTWKEICRISIPLYSISCFCWNKQQTIMPSSADVNAAASTVMTTQIILGTKEGSIGICDLSLPTQPQMLMLIPAHQSLISSIDWSPLNPLSVVTASMDGTVHLWNLADMYHSINLATSKGPYLQAQWCYKLSKAYDSRTAANDYAFPRVSGAGNAMDFDPARNVLVMDDQHYCKIIYVDEPGKLSLLPTSTPRTWSSIYPNARLQSPLVATADWAGRLELVAWRNDQDLKKSNFKHHLCNWAYDPTSRTFTSTVVADSVVEDNPETAKSVVGFNAIQWHLLPIGIFAVVSTTGLLYVRAI